MARSSSFGLKVCQIIFRAMQGLGSLVVFCATLLLLALLWVYGRERSPVVIAELTLAGVACIWAFVCMVLVCCLGGRSCTLVFANLFDLVFAGVYIFFVVRNVSVARCNADTVTTLFGDKSDPTSPILFQGDAAKAGQGAQAGASFDSALARITGGKEDGTKAGQWLTHRDACKFQSPLLWTPIILICIYFTTILIEFLIWRARGNEQREKDMMEQAQVNMLAQSNGWWNGPGNAGGPGGADPAAAQAANKKASYAGSDVTQPDLAHDREANQFEENRDEFSSRFSEDHAQRYMGHGHGFGRR